MILVDSNIPMYLVGADHPLKVLSQHLLQQHIIRGDRLVTDVEVYQEILHRYTAIRRPAAIDDAFQALSQVVDEVLSLERADVERARQLLRTVAVSARDAIHVAVMQRHGIDQIMSFDAGFDQFPEVTRIHRPT